MKRAGVGKYRRRTTNRSPFRYFKTSPEIIRLAAMLYVRFPLPLRNGEEMQKFVAVHTRFNEKRGLSSRDAFILERTAALADWRGLGLNRRAMSLSSERLVRIVRTAPRQPTGTRLLVAKVDRLHNACEVEARTQV